MRTDQIFHDRTNLNKNPYYDPKHDPYFQPEHFPDGTACPTCGAIVEKGSFRWPQATTVRRATCECPACRRIKDRVPGGIVTLTGAFVAQHESEIRNIAQNVERMERGEHPLQRIIECKNEDGGLQFITTYEHIARRIGEAVHSAYKGELSIQYAKDEKFVRIDWQRE